MPAPSEDVARQARATLQESCPPDVSAEFLLAIGANPSRQRNAAAAQAQGQYLIFLDSDCKVDASFWSHLADLRQKHPFDVVGGPVLLEEPAIPYEYTAQAVLGNSMITGQSAARYASIGELRTGNQYNLILANMVVRREVFTQSGGFNEELYPNEENEWLERLAYTVPGASLLYDPALTVHRPQRKLPIQLFTSFLRYGSGRSRQSLLTGRFNYQQIALFPTIIALLLGLWMMPLLTILCVLALSLGYLVMANSHRQLDPNSQNDAANFDAIMASGMIYVGYGIGQIIGLLNGKTGERWQGAVELQREWLNPPTSLPTPPEDAAAISPDSEPAKTPPPPENNPMSRAEYTPHSPADETSAPRQPPPPEL